MKLHIKNVVAPERQKYDEIWGVPAYRGFSPGLASVGHFMAVMKPARGSTIVDLGCGAGLAGLAFEELGLRAWWVDVTDAALDAKVDRQRFIKGAVWEREWTARMWSLGWDYGFCVDMLEHVPPEFSMLSLERIISFCRVSWLQIAFDDENFSKYINKPLHLTIRPFEWWRDRIASFGNLVEARHIIDPKIDRGLFIVERAS